MTVIHECDKCKDEPAICLCDRHYEQAIEDAMEEARERE